MFQIFEKVACSLLKCGQIPRHVAFIMDGNRRFADKANINKTDGHKRGFDQLAKVLNWCKDLGITHVTLFAFSVENFKRTATEVSEIMNLARQKCDSILDDIDKVNEAGICIKVAGDLHMIPEDLRIKVEKVQNMTCNNNKAFLNICLAYTSRHELVAAIKSLSSLVRDENNPISPSDIDLPLLESKLYLTRPFPDLIIRTSGEVRLSDFMLWQCQQSMLIFVDALWPEISIWDFLKAIYYFQHQRKFAGYFNKAISV